MTRAPLFKVLLALFWSWAAAGPLEAGFRFLDLSKNANMGPDESFDEAVPGFPTTAEKNALKDLPAGPQTFRGIPFEILDPAKNNGRSFVVLKGRKKPSFPEGVLLPAGNLKAKELFFLQTCRWGGTASDVVAAEYDILYQDGLSVTIPMRVGMELTNFWGADDTPKSFLAWWHKYRNAEMGVNLFPWMNPRPDVPIQSILFKSLSRMPVPILLAITASDEIAPVSPDSPKPEKTFQTDTDGWIALSPATELPAGSALDMSFLLDAPAGKHGAVQAQGGELVFADGTPARFWGVGLASSWSSLNEAQLSGLAIRLAAAGCNWVILDWPATPTPIESSALNTLLGIFKSKGIYLTLHRVSPVAAEPSPANGNPISDPALVPESLMVIGKGMSKSISTSEGSAIRMDNSPMVTKPEVSQILELVRQRQFGKPYGALWNFSWPNEYLSGSSLIHSAYSIFQGWNACAGGDVADASSGNMAADWNPITKPQLWTQWSLASLAFLRGDLKEGKVYVLTDSKTMPVTDLSSVLKALAHRTGVNADVSKLATDPAGGLKAKIQPQLKTFISDTGQITWQGNVGVVKVESPRYQALVGFLGHRKFNNASWALETPNSYLSLCMISLTPKGVSLSDHILLSGMTRVENTGMVYNKAKTKVLNLGHEPVLMEPLQAKFVLYRFNQDSRLKIRALDNSGMPLKTRVPYHWNGKNLIFSWVPQAAYLEIFKK